jgi:signal transduction histidine kinase
LINDVLDFQALDGSKFKLNSQENNINEVVEEVHETMAFSAKDKGIDFPLELDDNLPKASFDRNKIIQVLTNLVSNAIKFTPKHGRVSVTARCRSEELVIRISDTGMGIPKEALPKMFERFYRVNRPGEQIQGTGLGLAIVKKIVMMHNGRIEVESEVGRGTTITVFLPLTTKAEKERLPAKKDEHLESTLVNNQARTK